MIVRKTAGVRSSCIPELLAPKELPPRFFLFFLQVSKTDNTLFANIVVSVSARVCRRMLAQPLWHEHGLIG